LGDQNYSLTDVITRVEQRGRTLNDIEYLLKPEGEIYKILTDEDKKQITSIYNKNPEEFAFELEKLTQPESTVHLLSGFNYKQGRIIYKIKVENNTDSHIADINIVPFIPKNLFSIDKTERSISLIKSGEAQTVTFQLRPKGECGNVTISADVTYFNTSNNQHEHKKLKPKETAIICPMLKIIEITEKEWRHEVNKLIKVEESTEEIPIKAENFFKIISNALRDMNMYMLDPDITKDEKIFDGIARFYCKGIKGLTYGAQAEVIGGLKQSKLIIKAYAENQESLIGFYHCILDEIEKRTNIKKYISDTMVVQHIQEYVAGGRVEIKDSVVQRSKIDARSKDDDVEWK
jgi:hypothetical protein